MAKQKHHTKSNLFNLKYVPLMLQDKARAIRLQNDLDETIIVLKYVHNTLQNILQYYDEIATKNS